MDTDVLIVGAGPAGLVMANVLAAQGVDFRIVDRKTGPVTQSRAAILHVRTLELLDRLGVAQRAVAQGVKTTRVEIFQRGRRLGEFPLAGQDTDAHTPFPFALGLEQDRTERLLVDRLAEHGRTVRWQTELTALTSGSGGAAQARMRRRDGTEEALRARWVVAADGARSPLRHAAGIGFGGSTFEQTGLLADVELALPPTMSLPAGTIQLNLTRGGFVGMFALANGRHRLFGAVPPGLAAPSRGHDVSHEAYAEVPLDDIQRWFHDYFGIDARVTAAAWTALFRIHSRIADRFHAGNVFLVGDAAHIHSPAGGQGMNLAIGDAFNLGWKLACVAQKQAHESLLATYEAERRPVALRVLGGTDRGFALEVMRNPVSDWARAHVAARLIGPLSRLRPVRRAVFRLFSQTWIRYPHSPAVAGVRGRGPHPGDRAPHTPLIGGLRHRLLLFEGTGPLPSTAAITALARRYALDMTVQTVPAGEHGTHRQWHVHRPCLLLIRPDGHIGYSGPPNDLDSLRSYLDRLYISR